MRNSSGPDAHARAEVLHQETYDITQAMVKLNDMVFSIQREKLADSEKIIHELGN